MSSDYDSFESIRPSLADGDAEAASEVFRRFAHRLIGLARKRLDSKVRRKVDPEDVAQSVFKSFFRRQAEEGYEIESWDGLWSLLVVMTVRKCGRKVALLRAAKRDVRREVHARPEPESSVWGFEHAGDEPTPEEQLMLAETLEEVMAQLKPREQDMLSLKLQGCSVAEIAEQAGRTERTVQRLLKQVRCRLEEMCAKGTS